MRRPTFGQKRADTRRHGYLDAAPSLAVNNGAGADRPTEIAVCITYNGNPTMSIPTLGLSTGAAIPVVGLGMWKVENHEAPALVRQAIEVGYRHFDCACDYGNEAEVGEGLQQRYRARTVPAEGTVDHLQALEHVPSPRPRAGGLGPHAQRSATGLPRPLSDPLPHCAEFRAVRQALSAGLVLRSRANRSPHMVEDRVSIAETWEAMESLVQSGLRQEHRRLQFRLLAAARPAFLLADPSGRAASGVASATSSQEKLLRLCHQERIVFTAFSPLGSLSYVSLGMATPADSLLDHRGRSLDRPPTRARRRRRCCCAGAFSAAPSSSPRRPTRTDLRENLAIFDFELSPEEMAQLGALDQHRRFNDPGEFCEKAFNTFFPIYE